MDSHAINRPDKPQPVSRDLPTKSPVPKDSPKMEAKKMEATEGIAENLRIPSDDPRRPEIRVIEYLDKLNQAELAENKEQRLKELKMQEARKAALREQYQDHISERMRERLAQNLTSKEPL